MSSPIKRCYVVQVRVGGYFNLQVRQAGSTSVNAGPRNAFRVFGWYGCEVVDSNDQVVPFVLRVFPVPIPNVGAGRATIKYAGPGVIMRIFRGVGREGR